MYSKIGIIKQVFGFLKRFL